MQLINMIPLQASIISTSTSYNYVQTLIARQSSHIYQEKGINNKTVISVIE